MEMEELKTINDLPVNILPDYWNDKERINALYAPFRDKSVNSRDWETKLNFWKNLISIWCKFNRVCSFYEVELKKYLIHNDRMPACLNIVLMEMYKSGEIKTMDEFMEMPENSWSSWALDLAFKKPLKWSLNKMKTTFLSPVKNIKYIHLPTVQYLSENIFNSIPDNRRNKLLTIEEIIKLSKLENINIENFKLLLHHLLCNEKIDVYYGNTQNETEQNATLIKFAQLNKKIERVNEIDIGKYKLEQNEIMLIKKLEELENEKSEATKSAKAYLAKGMRQMAKNCLRKQHEIDKRIVKQVTVLENVQTLLDRINNAESDSNVLQSYKKGLEALKTVFKENGLSEDFVSDTMLEVGEVLEIHDDIQTSLAQPMTTTLDAELEEELGELLQDSTTGGGGGGGGSIPNKEGESKAKDEISDELEKRLQALKLPDTPNTSIILKSDPKMLPFPSTLEN